jgi:hypothetical protein
MNRATQHGENSRTLFAAWTLRQKTPWTLAEATPPRPVFHVPQSPVSPCTTVSLPPCISATLVPPSQAKRNRTSNRNTVANRNRRNLLKTKTRQISNRNKTRYVAFTDRQPIISKYAHQSAAYVYPTALTNHQSLHPGSDHEPGSRCAVWASRTILRDAVFARYRDTNHTFPPPPNAILFTSAERALRPKSLAAIAGPRSIQDWAGHRSDTGAEKRIGA